jgi:GntR family transcriptional regulator, transcriptional repressor for pyruvate dehydrogenase complex
MRNPQDSSHYTNRTQEAIENLLDFIKVNALSKGDMLPPEAELAEILQSSRTVLREALSYLKGLGLLSSKRGSGCRVMEIDPISIFNKLLHILSLAFTSDINELHSLRQTLELGSIETAVKKAVPEQVANIADIAGQMEILTGKDNVKLREYNKLEISFHQAIMAPSDNRMLDALNKAIELFFENEHAGKTETLHSQEDLQKMAAEHSLIAKAFLSKNPGAAYAALRQHVSSFENRPQED